jgi:hypothetical protein
MSEHQRSRQNRVTSPERWQAALSRALTDNVTVRQVNANGMWVATSGTDAVMAYLLEVTGGIVHSCTCPAGQYNDPVCKHRARWYYDAGLLDLDDDTPEPPPATPAAPVLCWHCQGAGQFVADTRARALALAPCPTCGGRGVASLMAQATALRAVVDEAGTDQAPIDTAGHIAGYDVLLVGVAIYVTHATSGRQWRHTVPNFGTSLTDLNRQPGLRLGWGRFPDDVEAIYLYDIDDGNFGYAFNLSDPALSEWGYAPFAGPDHEPACDRFGGLLDEFARTDDALTAFCGDCVEATRGEAAAAHRDVTVSTMSRLENGQQAARISTMRKLAEAVGATADVLIDGEREAPAMAGDGKAAA